MVMITETSGSTRAVSVLLIAKDHSAVRRIQKMLSDAEGDSYWVEVATSLSSGVEQLGQVGIDVVLLDLSLPETEGQDSLDSLCKQAPGVPVVLLMGQKQAAAAKALARVISGYVVKESMNTSVLELAITHALANRCSGEAPFEDRRFAALIEKSKDAVLIADSDGKLVYASPSYMSLFPFQHGGSLEAWVQAIHPEDISKAMELFAQITDKPGATVSAEIRAKDRTGAWRRLEATGTNYLSDQAIKGIVVNLRDISERKTTEEAVQARERYFRAIMDIPSGAVLVVSPDGHIVDTSGGLERISGYTRDKTIGASAAEFIHPEDAQMTGAAFAEALQNPSKTVSFEARLRNAQGAWQWTGCMITNLLDHPDVRGIVTHLIDISDRKRAEEALRLREEFYRRIIEKAPDGILIVDAIGTAKYASPSFPRLLGYGEDEGLGENAFNYMHPDDVAMVAEGYAQMAAIPGASAEVEVRIRHKDGTWRWCHISGINHLDDPAVNGVVLNFFDITSRRQAEEALRLKEEFYRRLTEKSPDSILILDSAGAMVYKSPSFPRLLGYTEDEELGQSAFDWVHPEDMPRILEVFGQLLASPGASAQVEVRVRHKDGWYIWIQALGTNHLDDPAVKGLVINLRDISERKRAEEALLDSERRFKQLFTNVNDEVVFVDLNGTTLDVNNKVADIFGYRPEELIGCTFAEFDIFSPETLAQLTELFVKSVTAVGALQPLSNIPAIHKDGHQIYIEASTCPITGAQGELVGFCAIIRDITERKRMEEALRENQEKLRIIFESITDGITVTDLAGVIVDVNEAALRLYGDSSREESVGRNGLDYIAERDRDTAVQELGRALAAGAATETVEYALRRRDGIEFEAELKASLLHDRSGNPVGIVNVTRDITQRKRAEEALQERENKFRQLFTNVSDVVLFSDLSGLVLDVNDRIKEVFGYSREEVLGRNFAELGALSAETLSQLAGALMEVAAKQTVVPMLTVPALHRDGHPIHLEVCCSQLKGPQGQLAGVVSVIKDVTERKKAEDQLRKLAEDLSARNIQLDAAREDLTALNQHLEEKVQERTAEVQKLLDHKDEFIRQLGHDLNTPVTPLVVLLPLLREEMQEPEQKEMLDAVIDNVGFIRELVAKTLKLSQLSSVTSEVAAEDVRLDEEVDRVVRSKGLKAYGKGVTLLNDVQELIIVRSDHLSLHEVLDHLLANAIKFTPQGGTVTMSATKDDHFAIVSVKDTGIGMTSEQLSHLFEEFYKADPSRHELDASGLGLAICKRIVERAGGKIWAESEGLGKGSTFFFTLRLANGDSK